MKKAIGTERAKKPKEPRSHRRKSQLLHIYNTSFTCNKNVIKHKMFLLNFKRFMTTMQKMITCHFPGWEGERRYHVFKVWPRTLGPNPLFFLLLIDNKHFYSSIASTMQHFPGCVNTMRAYRIHVLV